MSASVQGLSTLGPAAGCCTTFLYDPQGNEVTLESAIENPNQLLRYESDPDGDKGWWSCNTKGTRNWCGLSTDDLDALNKAHDPQANRDRPSRFGEIDVTSAGSTLTENFDIKGSVSASSYHTCDEKKCSTQVSTRCDALPKVREMLESPLREEQRYQNPMRLRPLLKVSSEASAGEGEHALQQRSPHPET